MKLLPSEPFAVETALPPSRLLREIERAVDERNRTALLLGLRSEVDQDRIVVGWWPRVAFVRGGVAFVGRAVREGQRTVLSGEVRLFPRWYARLQGAVLLLAAAMPLVFALDEREPWFGVAGAAWMLGGGRAVLELMFRADRRRIERALRTAAAGGVKPSRAP